MSGTYGLYFPFTFLYASVTLVSKEWGTRGIDSGTAVSKNVHGDAEVSMIEDSAAPDETTGAQSPATCFGFPFLYFIIIFLTSYGCYFHYDTFSAIIGAPLRWQGGLVGLVVTALGGPALDPAKN